MPNRPAKSGADNDRDFDLSPAGGLDRDAAMIALAEATTAPDLAARLTDLLRTEGQRTVLLNLGCRYGQGYLFGRPAPAAHWLAARGD